MEVVQVFYDALEPADYRHDEFTETTDHTVFEGDPELNNLILEISHRIGQKVYAISGVHAERQAEVDAAAQQTHYLHKALIESITPQPVWILTDKRPTHYDYIAYPRINDGILRIEYGTTEHKLSLSDPGLLSILSVIVHNLRKIHP